jgi:hypothetical protein
MADWLTLKTLILPGMHAVTIDLSSAFHHLGVVPSLRRLLCFRYDGITYRYIGLPFGLRSAPRLFCEALGGHHECSADAVAGRDDVRVAALQIVDFIAWLGWTPNRLKCSLDPATSVVYLGIQWDTTTMTVRMTTKKNTSLKHTVKRWIR